ncbi:MAG TPA: hypothetical protein VHZ54_09455 [Solirubrobacterales bacterium]|nr:hypothetical protein [Solirubrobacterales bacterium]
MTETSTDKRVDGLRSEVHEGFARTDKRVDDLRVEMHHGFEQVDQRFDRVGGDVRELRGEVHGLRSDMKGGFAAIEAKFDAKFDSLDRTIIYLLGGSLSVVTGGILAAVFHALF